MMQKVIRSDDVDVDVGARVDVYVLPVDYGDSVQECCLQ